MRSSDLLLLVAILLSPPLSLAAPSPAAVDRGRLSLARDAHDSGRCEEALGYLAEIAQGSPVIGEAGWLRAECLFDLARYPEAAVALQGLAVDPDERTRFLLDVHWAWAWEATAEEDYREAELVCRRGLTAVPGDLMLESLWQASRFRGALAAVAQRERAILETGEEVAVLARGQRPAGPGWVRAYPWDLGHPWVPKVTLDDWMPSLGARLDRLGRALWVRLPKGVLDKEVLRAAGAAGLRVRPADDGVALSLVREWVSVAYGEWGFRAAAEGLGGRGAALGAVAEARLDLEDGEALWSWAEAHRGDLAVTRDGRAILVRDPRTGRSARLDPRVWPRDPRDGQAEGRELWMELRVELRRPARPFYCFCGREARLREVLVADPGRAVAVERGRGYAVVLTAQCLLHQQSVDSHLLWQWGVTEAEARTRALADGAVAPWELWFGRGEAAGVRYLVLEGDGASGLARRPELLLGAVEAADGAGARGSAVRVHAPASSFLVVTPAGAPEGASEAAAAQAILGASRRGWRSVERLDYRATLQLPAARVGQFRLTAAE